MTVIRNNIVNIFTFGLSKNLWQPKKLYFLYCDFITNSLEKVVNANLRRGLLIFVTNPSMIVDQYVKKVKVCQKICDYQRNCIQYNIKHLKNVPHWIFFFWNNHSIHNYIPKCKNDSFIVDSHHFKTKYKTFFCQIGISILQM